MMLCAIPMMLSVPPTMPQSLVIPEKFQHIICMLLLLSYAVCIQFSMAAPIPSMSAPLLSMAAPIPLMAAPILPMGAAIPEWPPPSHNGCPSSYLFTIPYLCSCSHNAVCVSHDAVRPSHHALFLPRCRSRW